MGELDTDALDEALGGRSELEVLLEQLEELLAEGVTTGEDALEVATVAGLAVRLGADPESLADAQAWLGGGGLELVEEGLEQTDMDELIEALDSLDQADEHEVEEAFSDFDDVIAAAVWVGHGAAVRDAARKVAAVIRQVPDPFAFMGPTGALMARSRFLAEDLEVHDYWLAIAEAGAWADES